MPFDLASAKPVFDLASATEGGTPVQQFNKGTGNGYVDAAQAFATGTNRALLGMAGMGVDAIANVRDLGKAALGTPFLMAGKVPPEALQIGNRAADIGSSANLIRSAPASMVQAVNPEYEGGYLQAAGSVPLAMIGAGNKAEAAKQLALGAASVLGSKKAHDVAINNGLSDSAANTLAVTAGLAPQTAMSAVSAFNNRASAVAEANKQRSLNAPKDAVLKEARDAGYTIPNSEVAPTFLGNRLESLGGKTAIKQESTLRNQEATNALARKALGMADDAPITVSALEKLREDAGRPYQQVAALSPQAKIDLEAWKDSQYQTSLLFKQYNKNGDPGVLAKAKTARAETEMFAQELERHAVVNGRPDLVPALIEARKQIAKTYTVERALSGVSDVSAPVLGRLWQKGDKLSDGLDVIGRTNKEFPYLTGEANKTPVPGVSKAEALGAGLFGVLGHAAAPGFGTSAALLAFAPHPARALALSKMMQRTPQYGPTPGRGLLDFIPPTLPMLSGQSGLLAQP